MNWHFSGFYYKLEQFLAVWLYCAVYMAGFPATDCVDNTGTI